MRRRHGAPGFNVGVEPGRDAAVGEIAVPASRIDPRVVAPDLAPGRRLERHHLSERRADVHHVVDDDRRHLQRGLLGEIERRLACLIAPGDDELGHVVAGDARQRRESRAAGVAAVGRASRLGVASERWKRLSAMRGRLRVQWCASSISTVILAICQSQSTNRRRRRGLTPGLDRRDASLGIAVWYSVVGISSILFSRIFSATKMDIGPLLTAEQIGVLLQGITLARQDEVD